MRTVEFEKGHGTLNDFVIVADYDGVLDLPQADVKLLCDRKAGIGADGLVRVVPASKLAGYEDSDLWFMDYRNADGSIAQMCGNGLRVFVKHLVEHDLVDSNRLQVMTRAGIRQAWVLTEGMIKVSMGKVKVAKPDSTWITVGKQRFSATPVDVGNPHAVVRLENVSQLGELDLSQSPKYDETVFNEGVNVEFITGQNPIQMRVFERGVGETMSCGTGVVASAAVAKPDISATVKVPGGVLQVEFDSEQAYLTGPAEIIASGKLNLESAAKANKPNYFGA